MVLAVTTTILVLLFFLILTCVQTSPQTESSLSSHEMTKDISCCGSKGLQFENTYLLTQLIIFKLFIFYNSINKDCFFIGPENISLRCPNGREGPGDVIIGNSCLRLVIFLIVVCLVSCCTIVVLVGNYVVVEMCASVFFLTWYVIFSKCSLFHFPWESRLVITIRERTEP